MPDVPSDLPSGQVTLLFSDIEGSTSLLARLGSEYGTAVLDHRGLQRSAFADHGGVEMGTEGDSFFVVFETASAAVGAAITSQHRLATLHLPDGARMRAQGLLD